MLVPCQNFHFLQVISKFQQVNYTLSNRKPQRGTNITDAPAKKGVFNVHKSLISRLWVRFFPLPLPS
ncbi:hypothetical protein CAP36_02520 [Chitinophagaceae bacterium IBVUCB2]|nr:hypothetical protein CAP36_02520 [Chitinophagaceae bacterium IBVUCB2]